MLEALQAIGWTLIILCMFALVALLLRLAARR